MRKALLIVLTGLVALVCGVLNSAAEAPAPADPSAAPSADPSAAPAPAPLPEPLRPNKVRVAQLVAGTTGALLGGGGARFVCGWDCRPEWVDALIADARAVGPS